MNTRPCRWLVVLFAWVVLPGVADAQGSPDPAGEGGLAQESDGDVGDEPNVVEGLPAATETPEPATVPAGEPPEVETWQSRLYDSVARSVVLIRTDDGGVGSGFIFHSPRHVATAYHVVENAELIGVTVPGFEPMRAEVVAWDRANDLAILELPGEIQNAPVLVPYETDPHIGMEVAVIGHPYSQYAQSMDELQGLLDWTLTSGIVGGVSEGWLQMDAAVNPGNSGGPVLSRDGRVLGVVSARLNQAEGIGLATRVGTLVNLSAMIGMSAPPMNNVDRDKLELAFMIHWDRSTLVGFAIGGGALFYRRVPLRLRVGFLSGGDRILRSDVIRRDIDRYAFELEAGYHLPFFQGMSVSLLLGAAIDIDVIEETIAGAIDDGSCTTAPCAYPVGITTREQTVVSARPQIGISATVFVLRVSYAFQADFNDFDESVHRFYVAVAL